MAGAGLLTDFAKISLATGHVRPSKKSETWNIGGFFAVSVVHGIRCAALLWRAAWRYRSEARTTLS
jgi:hypothetical protein